MIRSFGDPTAEDIFHEQDTKAARRLPRDLWGVAQRKLDRIRRAQGFKDLGIVPGDRLKKLKGKLKGQFSIRINDQFRVLFFWSDGDAYDVRIEDYH